MNILATRTTAVFAAMAAVIILAFAGAMTATAQSAPERPTDLTAAATHHDTVSLTWSHPNPATVDHYQVLSRRADSGTGIAQVGTSTTTSFEHNGLEPESTYIYRVRPVNSAGQGGQRSARAEATTPADDTPAPEPDPTPVPDPTPAGPERNDQRNTRGSHATAHVSNIGQASTGSAFSINTTISQAQGFTTGSQSGGYPFSTVGMQFASGSATASGLVIAIYSAAAGGGPDSAVYTLTNPSRLERDGATESLFTAPANSTLSAGTTYFVVATASGAFTVQVTAETDEDSGASTGWSIADKRHFRNISVNNDWSESAAKLKIGIYPPSTTTLSTDATLSDLELEDDSGTAITLSPSFVLGTTTYTANVVNSVDEITVTPTVNDSNADHEIQNSAGTALTDADTNTTGFQVDLSEGANIINVEVTAEDASTETYTVTVTRTPADCETDDIWCATLTVGTHTAGGLTFYGYSVGLGDTTGTLSPNTFTYRAATIGVLALKYDSGATGTLRWGISLLSGTTPTDGVLGDDDFTLHAGTHTFAIDAPGTTTTFTFPDHGLSWTVGDTVTVRLVKNPSSDVTLSTLVVNDGTDDLSPDPAFDPATLGYSVEVAHDVDEVTVTPTLNDTSASYEIQDDEGAALTDVDTTQDDFQVSISPGPNTINVVITGADGHTTQTYTVTVQRINILVSNIDQATAVAIAVGNNGSAQIKHAQKFTTGSNTSGYTLYDVKLFLDSSASSEPIVTVNTADGNNPDTLLYNLTAKDSSLTLDGPRRFTANPGATLEASTSYFIVAANGNTTNSTQARYNLYLTDSNAQDSTGLSDWSITDSGRTGNPNWSGTPSNRAFNIQVRGTVTPASDDATLSTLVLQDASDDSVLTLDPTFDAATLEYGATVGRGVGEITIIPTPNDTDADHEVQDGDGAALTDADTTQDDFQVSIARGLNTIQVEVTAEDATTQTYTVTVTRPRILVSSTGQTSGGSAETGNHNGNQTKHAQKFTTGSNPAGYTLDEVRIHLGTNGNAAAPVITVNSGSGNNPGAVLYTMTNPATITDETTNTFTAPSGATLEADTNYFVVMENSNTNDDPNALYQVGITASNGEDSTGLSDWDIDDTGRTGTPGWSATSGNVAFRIQVRGTVDVDPNAAALPELSFDSINITVDEDGSQAALSVELSQTSTDAVTVDYATSDNTAEAGDDYTETSGTLTFAAGETVMAIIVPILDDAIYETLERFNVTLSNPAGATLPAFPGAQINIALDESPPTASIDDVTVSEGAGTMTLTLNLSHESSRRTPYRTQTSYIGGTATQGADYVNFISGGEARITVPAGDTQATLDITITDDTAGESSETITIRWDNDPTGGNNGDATPATINFTGTITDNDSGVQLTIQDASADETNSSIAFRIDSSETLTQDVTFNYSTSIGASDSAEADDFDPESAVSHTLSAGSVRGLIDIYLNDDDLYEGDETFTVTISNPVNASIADATATGTIIDDETQPTLEVSPASATEGDDIIFLVDLIGPLTEDDVTFNYATSRQSDDTSEAIDFTRTTGTETIAAGSSATTITVPTYDDGTNNDTTSTYEGDETFTVTISNPTLAGISQATAKGTILDDESLPTVKFIANNRVTAEHTGSITNFIEFSVVPKGEQSAQVSLTLAGTATRNDDYLITSTTLTVSANQSQIATPITVVNDDIAEVTETLIITVVAASANIQVDPDFSTRTLTIEDDDEHPTVGFTSESFDVDEDAGNAILTVNKTGLSDFPVHVEYETVSRDNAVAGDDYVATSGTLTFQPNETSKTISVPIIDNNVYQINDKIFDVDLDLSSLSPHGTDPILEPDNTVVSIASEDPVPTASMANVTANERAGTMTVTLRLSNPSHEDIQYIANHHAVSGTATRDEDYVDFIPGAQAYITVSAGQQSGHFDITLIDDGLEEEDENIHIRWVRREPSTVNPQYLDLTGTITDPPICDALGNLENTIVVMNLTGEITQPGQSKFHRIKLDPYRSYMIEAIGHNGEDMLGVEEHPNLTLFNPDIPAIWNARATSRWSTYGDRNDGDQPKNAIRRFLDSSYRTYKVEVNAGNNGTGTYQLKIRVNNICRLDENDNAHYQWAGGPLGYPKGSDLPAGIGGRQVLLTGTDWGNNNVTRPEMHHVLGDNWSSDRDEDWIGVDLEDGELYTVRLRTKNNLPERLQATGLKILGIYDSNGNPISGTASAGAAGKKVFVTDWTAPSTGRFHIAVGSEGNDRTGMYWLSIIKDATN